MFFRRKDYQCKVVQNSLHLKVCSMVNEVGNGSNVGRNKNYCQVTCFFQKNLFKPWRLGSPFVKEDLENVNS